MFQFDDAFLNQLGLGDLPEDQRKSLLAKIIEEVQVRVGTKLSEGMSDEQLDEFEGFMPQEQGTYNQAHISGWLEKNSSGYQTSEEFKTFVARFKPGTPQAAILSEFASVKWLAINRPDYREVVDTTVKEVSDDIRRNREAILGNTAA